MNKLATAAARLVVPPGRNARTMRRDNPTKTTRFTCKATRAPDGMIDFIGSTSEPDRAGDIVEQNWDLDAYRKNPIVLYGHDHEGLPVGKAVRVGVKAGALSFRVKFVPREIYPFAGVVQDLYAGGFLKAFSVGFRPIETKMYADAASRPAGLGAYGQHITKSELLEVSAVPVPANASALVSAGAGARIAPIYKGRGEDAAIVTKGLKVAEAKEWLMKVKGDEAPVAEELDATGHCDAALAILEASDGVTPDTLKEAIEHLKAVKATMMPEDEEPEAEEPGEAEPEEDDEEEEEPIKALTARVAALEKKHKSGHDSDEIEDEVEAALAGDLELPGLVALESALGLDDEESEES